ncbi:MAG TPA: hypothetical protein VM451_10980 [Candidatus Limnocylindria bacterium]|nr:hypothetical protein [Candidatus Limnocylindria bacterium]
MTHVPRPPAASMPPDDAAIEQLVRDVAAGWTMPPVRLDAPSWRNRVRSPRVRRMAAAHGWLGRLGQAASAAVALTVVAALGAILLTGPGPAPGKTPAPTGASPDPSRVGTTSVLPRVLVEGALPTPARLLVQAESDYVLVDLEKGAATRPITGARYGSHLRQLPDGTLVCLCLFEAERVNGVATRVSVSLDHFDAEGGRTSSTQIETFAGAPDPRDAEAAGRDETLHVETAMSSSDDGRYGFLGWSARAHPVWKSGIVVVDLADGTVVSRLSLPDVGTGEGSRRTIAFAPRILGSSGAGEVLVGRDLQDWSGPDLPTASVAFDNDVYRADLADGRLANPTLVPNTFDCGDGLVRGGAFAGGGIWLACTSDSSGSLILRRVDRAGRLLQDVTASRRGVVGGDTSVTSADGRSIFAWDPFGAQLARIDVATGEKTTSPAVATATAAQGPLRDFGEWLAPTVAAKTFLQTAVVVSPDGSRVYALGITGGASEREMSGSSGVFVFDAGTLEPIGHWEPTADFVSLAISADGRSVYAAGAPGFDAGGRILVTQAASITVFAAIDGSRQVINGQLGPSMLMFPEPVVR